MFDKRAGRTRDRRDRGPRGPLVLPGPLTPRPPDVVPSRRDDFDDLVLAMIDRLTPRFPELRDVEFGTEEVPVLPDDWSDEPVPFGSLTPAASGRPARIVLFRRPIELRAPTRVERTALVREVVAEHVADLLGRDPSEVDP